VRVTEEEIPFHLVAWHDVGLSTSDLGKDPHPLTVLEAPRGLQLNVPLLDEWVKEVKRLRILKGCVGGADDSQGVTVSFPYQGLVGKNRTKVTFRGVNPQGLFFHFPIKAS
jgi:hypothetical protein